MNPHVLVTELQPLHFWPFFSCHLFFDESRSFVLRMGQVLNWVVYFLTLSFNLFLP